MDGRLRELGEAATDRVAHAGLGPVLGRAGIRVYQANLHRIGDTASELTLYVKLRRVGWRAPSGRS